MPPFQVETGSSFFSKHFYTVPFSVGRVPTVVLDVDTGTGNSWFQLQSNAISVADPHHFNGDPDADPDPACHFDADLDPNHACHFDADLTPTFNFDADPIPVPSFQINAQNLEKVLKQAHMSYTSACYLQIYADPDSRSGCSLSLLSGSGYRFSL